MANASAKRVAAQNEEALRNLQRGMFITILLSLLFRFFLRGSIVPSKTSTVVHVLTFIPLFILYRHLHSIGSPRRDPTTNALIGSVEDLNMRGVTEWCWDIIYVTWACQVGSALLGEWCWWLYLCIPLFAVWKLWSVFIGPYFFNSRGGGKEAPVDENSAEQTSKRQQKLKKRSEKGDPRVKSTSAYR